MFGYTFLAAVSRWTRDALVVGNVLWCRARHIIFAVANIAWGAVSALVLLCISILCARRRDTIVAAISTRTCHAFVV